MKIIPSNQTLILANERGSAGPAAGAAVRNALRAASADGMLNRVTILAAHPDASVLYLQADYSTPGAAYRTLPSPAAASEADLHPATGELTVLASESVQPDAVVAPTAYYLRRGARLYQDTQGLQGSAAGRSTLDVHA